MFKEPVRAPYRQRFFSSMDYDEYVMHFGPPKPLLRPSADPELLDNFQLNPQSKFEARAIAQQRLFSRLPPIRELRIEQENSNNNSSRFMSPLIEFEEEPKPTKRPYSRMRSQSENHAYLIFNLLDRQDGMQRKKIKLIQ